MTDEQARIAHLEQGMSALTEENVALRKTIDYLRASMTDALAEIEENYLMRAHRVLNVAMEKTRD